MSGRWLLLFHGDTIINALLPYTVRIQTPYTMYIPQPHNTIRTSLRAEEKGRGGWSSPLGTSAPWLMRQYGVPTCAVYPHRAPRTRALVCVCVLHPLPAPAAPKLCAATTGWSRNEPAGRCVRWLAMGSFEPSASGSGLLSLFEEGSPERAFLRNGARRTILRGLGYAPPLTTCSALTEEAAEERRGDGRSVHIVCMLLCKGVCTVQHKRPFFPVCSPSRKPRRAHPSQNRHNPPVMKRRIENWFPPPLPS